MASKAASSGRTPRRDDARREAGETAAARCAACPLEAAARRRGIAADALLEEMASLLAEDHALVERLVAATGGEAADGAGGTAGRFAALVTRLYGAVADQLRGVETAGEGAGDKDARILQTLAKTVETLKGLEMAADGGGDPCAKEIDLASMRAEIAKRLDRLGETG